MATLTPSGRAPGRLPRATPLQKSPVLVYNPSR